MKYPRELLEEAVRNSTSYAGVIRYLGLVPAGGTHANLSRRIKKEGIDTAHFTGKGHNRGRPTSNRYSWQQVLVVRPAGSPRAKPKMLRRALVEAGVPYVCALCGVGDEWNGKQLTLHVDHINGDYLDSRLENVRFLCPNCHSQTASWAGRNRWARPEGEVA
ncbi:HNH endonuclease [Antrihabitans stalactiti]|uniref:HNH endonuclease n=1 Tax=Antrihabitans stalactiti TaxID=2584121 RepID=A0A848KRD2_9NOCA|nr:HNH endonuclease [Antrihabitans stalactiti]